MPAFHPFGSDAVVDISDELVERYTEQGWTPVEQPKKVGRPAKSDEDSK